MSFKNWLSQLLDQTLLFSFDRTGFRRHCPTPLKRVALSGKKGIITGASSGIGLAVAKSLINQGLNAILIGRNREKVEADLKPYFHVLDMGNIKQVYAFAKNEVKSGIDLLIHNAGGMPNTLTLTAEGNEAMFASQVLGPYTLTRALADMGKLNPGCRIIFVSSGGMYAQKLDLSDLTFAKRPYNKYTGYANAKRAQVILGEKLSQKYPNFCVSTMHPGWVDTPGVEASMPLFRKLINTRLRSPDEGADTVIWLATTSDTPSGKFWFDRAEAPTTLFNLYDSTDEEKQRLWNLCESTYLAAKES
jgi:dehydrogenase/reductase SDR family protein 12